MKRTLCTFVVATLLTLAPAWADVTLRDRVEASGPAVTLGDVFNGTGAASGRAIAPAPSPGQVSILSPAVLTAAASAAGLDWTPPANLNAVRVTRPGGARATLPPQTPTNFANGGSTQSIGDAAVHRGEMVTLVYRLPGMELSAHARAVEDGAIGQTIRLTNLTSNRVIDATITGPGVADANATP